MLFGSDYWGGLLDWLRSTVLPAGMINAPDLELVHLTDDIDDAVAHILGAEDARSGQRRTERAVADAAGGADDGE